MHDMIQVSDIEPSWPSCFSFYPCVRHNYITIWNILMTLFSNVYEVKTVCHVQKKIAIPFSISELLPFDETLD